MCWITKCSTSSSILETYNSRDITSGNFVDIITLISKHTNDTANAFLVASSGVKDIRT